ncbi:MAG: choice-of-anchor B family protein, partial [Bacteroidota bacterium]
MKRTLVTLLLAAASTLAFSQLNMTLTDHIDYGVDCSNIWGWVDPDDGMEYALVGVSTGLSIVSLADPYNVVEVGFIPDVNSSWREVKAYDHYAYAVTEGGGGVLVVDLHDAPNSFTYTHWSPSIPELGGGTLNRIHALFIDEFGYLYLNGATGLNSGGVIIADIHTDPANPVYVGHAPAIYCHDSYARNNILFTGDIYAGQFSVYDVSDKSNVQLLAKQTTPYAFTHNLWLNDASTVLFTTDEKANAPVASYDISDLTNIKELDQFRPIATLGTGVIPHNVQTWNDYVVTSYYTDGTIIIDGSKPDNLIEVGYFDSFVNDPNGFHGVWGVFPYFPSGLVVASDIENGFYCYEVNYVRACWLEGKVTSSATSLPINGASVHIESTQANQAATGADGLYKTGQAIPGTFDVVVSAVGYTSKTVQAVLENGILTILDVQLDPLSSFSVSGQAVRTTDNAPVPGATIFADGTVDFSATADANGNFTFPGIFGGTYTLYAGAWGYKAEVISNFTVDNTTQPVTIFLEPGYQDEFILDFGWTKSSTASTGAWERGEPVGTTNGNGGNQVQVAPNFDVTTDLGDQCYVTQNGLPGGSAADTDVDNGVVTLTSPIMDLSSYANPVMHYQAWFFNAGGSGTPNDNLTVKVTNGTDVVTLETVTQSASQWRPETSFELASLLPLTSTMQVIFETGDYQPGHLVEAAVDAFSIENAQAGAPAAFFTTSSNSGCAPFTVQFTDQSTGTPTTWAWEFEGGNPATSTSANPVVVYSTPGAFTVKLKVTNAIGESETVENQLIQVSGFPAVGFNFFGSEFVVTFQNTSTGATSYTWDFGDGTTSTEANPSHTYAQNGN